MCVSKTVRITFILMQQERETLLNWLMFILQGNVIGTIGGYVWQRGDGKGRDRGRSR